MLAARHWAEGGQPDRSGLEADLKAFGLSPEAFADADTAPDPDFQILPENWDAVQVFVACSTQWQYAGMTGQPTGLQYPALESAIRLMGISDPADTFHRVRVMESEALRAMRETQV